MYKLSFGGTNKLFPKFNLYSQKGDNIGTIDGYSFTLCRTHHNLVDVNIFIN